MKCIYCGYNFLDNNLELAQHILDANDGKHQKGLVWANKFMERMKLSDVNVKRAIDGKPLMTKEEFYAEMLEKEKKQGVSPSL